MKINNITDVLEQVITVAQEDMPNIIDTSLLMHMVPYKSGYSTFSDVQSEGKTPIRKRITIYISVEDA